MRIKDAKAQNTKDSELEQRQIIELKRNLDKVLDYETDITVVDPENNPYHMI